MTSRLDRLFVLLESGASGVTRRAAARQLGEVQRTHPHELQRLLARLASFLRSPAWETRVAAAQAVEAILANVPEWDPPPCTVKKEDAAASVEVSGRLSCATFSLERVLAHGAHLMGSEGAEYDMEEANTQDSKEKIVRQRQQLNARLGLDVAAKLGMDMSEIYTNEDLLSRPLSQQPHPDSVRTPVPELMLLPGKLSSREMNRARRKARQAVFSKHKSRDAPADEGCSTPLTPTPPVEPERKKAKTDDDAFFPEECTICSDGTWSASCASWPLESWSCAVAAGLYVGAWETRHGAASALRELLRARVAAGAGKRRGQTAEEMEEAHQAWMEDMSLRLLCVLALDRFGDFVSDQVVAPVRETCAQALGVALSRLSAPRVCGVAALLSRLAREQQWEARHGALLGFKYLIAAREELACPTGAFEQLITGLSDPVEDVGAIAAGALAPAAASFVRARPDALKLVVARLWELLREQDDLAAACNSYMALLAALLSLPHAAAALHPIDLTDVLPRLWPYLDHSTSSVRKATLQTIRTLTKPLIGPVNKEQESKCAQGTEIKADKNSIEENKINTKTENEETKKYQNREGIDSKMMDREQVKNEDDLYMQWTPELLAEAMRYIYQRALFEHVHDIQEIAEQVWENLLRYSRLDTLLLAACPLLSTWLCLAMQPVRTPVDPALLLQPPLLKERRHRPGNQESLAPLPGSADAGAPLPGQKWYLGGAESTQQAVRERNVTRVRCLAARMLGFLSCYLVQPAPGVEYKSEAVSPIDCYAKVLVVYLRSGSALQRLVTSLVLCAWAQCSVQRNFTRAPASTNRASSTADGSDESTNHSVENGDSNGTETNEITLSAPKYLIDVLHSGLEQNIYYDEVALSCTRVLQEARDLVAMMRHYQFPVEGDEFSNIVSIQQVSSVASLLEPIIASSRQKRISQQLEERRRALQAAATQCLAEHHAYNVSVLGAMAGACAWLRALPDRLNPVVKPLMESIKKEPAEELQNISGDTLAFLLAQCSTRTTNPATKVLLNLNTALRCDPEFTPRVALDTTEESVDSGSDDSGAEAVHNTAHGISNLDRHRGILTLYELQRAAERGAGRRGGGGAGRPPGRPPADAQQLDHMLLQEDDTQKQLQVQRRGATYALNSLTRYFGQHLPEKLPKLWEFITSPFCQETNKESETSPALAEEMISRLQVIEAVSSSIAPELLSQLAERAGSLARLVRHRYTAVRHMAARCLAALALHAPDNLMQLYINEVVPALSVVGEERVRCGAAEALARVVEALQLQIVPYIVLLVVPLLGRMSDHCEAVRLMSTRCFASLIQLMPLEGAIPEPRGLSDELRQCKARDKLFLDQLFNPKSIKDYKIPIPVAAELRSYQQAGVNWLRFLNEYKLHGVLCDDMGLGKTLQSIVVVAGEHHERKLRFAATRSADHAPLPSLVVCPPTLTGHWVYEVKKFIDRKYLNPLQYIGPPLEREKLRLQVKNYNLIVASYDIVRKDIDFFSSVKWNYCILDEGHIIKNGKTKAFKAIKMLTANHRLILSGTPIQNNVLELWSLFDFLMPGLLGTERQFMARYSRAILAARDPRATPHHQQAGAKAMEALHRQVLPFLLRRVKEDVLTELPPKITQDYYCELSPLQRRLYEDFSRTHIPDGIDENKSAAHGHVFQALRYLQNVCNHPKLVLTDEHPECARVRSELATQQSHLADIQHAAKLPALKQLLQDCGIGGASSPTGDQAAPAVVSQHRALIFCQLKAMLDIVEKDLLKPHLPGVSYLRLDGAVAPGARQATVQRFNNDPSIDVLLLTTKVGGLGLNLTGADTVIFVEHDWNPMRDVQAMDRAHRIGQRRVVNVYRLITRNTLEEKIMGLQKFKLQTANTVISNENASLETMGTEQLLDLFHLSSDAPAAPVLGGSGTGQGGSGASQGGSGAGQWFKAVLDTLPDLWDDKQYEEEYDMTAFIQGLSRSKQ